MGPGIVKSPFVDIFYLFLLKLPWQVSHPSVQTPPLIRSVSIFYLHNTAVGNLNRLTFLFINALNYANELDGDPAVAELTLESLRLRGWSGHPLVSLGLSSLTSQRLWGEWSLNEWESDLSVSIVKLLNWVFKSNALLRRENSSCAQSNKTEGYPVAGDFKRQSQPCYQLLFSKMVSLARMPDSETWHVEHALVLYQGLHAFSSRVCIAWRAHKLELLFY